MNAEFTPLHNDNLSKVCCVSWTDINIYVLITVPGVCYVSYNWTAYMAFMTCAPGMVNTTFEL